MAARHVASFAAPQAGTTIAIGLLTACSVAATRMDEGSTSDGPSNPSNAASGDAPLCSSVRGVDADPRPAQAVRHRANARLARSSSEVSGARAMASATNAPASRCPSMPGSALTA